VISNEDLKVSTQVSLGKFRTFLIVLAVLIVGLMALGAGVRTMNAGLACPDWPLCFGKVIPDFHVGVWFEFVHRAYAGIVAILYAVALVIALRSKVVPGSTKTAAKFGFIFLGAQIVMGGLTVLMLVKAVIVTTHLLLATLFLSCMLWMLFGVHEALRQTNHISMKPAKADAASKKAVRDLGWLSVFLPVVVFIQIAIGGFVASTYAGMVCVDWPYCNGQWVPTLKGPMGLQIIHRFYAYALVFLFIALAMIAYVKREVLPKSISRTLYASGIVVILQTVVGILNLLYFIPPHITVLHQTLGMFLLGMSLKLSFELRLTVAASHSATLSENRAELTEPLF
jgi:cytochrome c oxidase assembly protein subunit 15